MARTTILNHFKKVEFPDPADEVIKQIKDLIHQGLLKPGDRLPSEKRIEERTGIPRSQINRALRRLDTFGVLRTVPQSGTYVRDIGQAALEGLLSNLIKAEDRNLQDLAETRRKLEELAVELVIKRATDEEIAELEQVQQKQAARIRQGQVSIDDDLVFHIKIAEFSKNTVLKAVLSLLTVDFIQLIKSIRELSQEDALAERLNRATAEHQAIVEAIKKRDAYGAVAAMQEHYARASEFYGSE